MISVPQFCFIILVSFSAEMWFLMGHRWVVSCWTCRCRSMYEMMSVSVSVSPVNAVSVVRHVRWRPNLKKSAIVEDEESA